MTPEKSLQNLGLEKEPDLYVHMDHSPEYDDAAYVDTMMYASNLLICRNRMYTSEAIRSQTRAESAQILSQKYSEREKVKQQRLAEERQARVARQRRKQAKITQWQSKTKRSPFMVDLLAENERIDEVCGLVDTFVCPYVRHEMSHPVLRKLAFEFEKKLCALKRWK